MSSSRKTSGRPDLLWGVGAAAFMAAAIAAAWPVVRGQPVNLAGLLLILGLALVTALGLIAFRPGDAEDAEGEAEPFLSVLDEPAALVTPEGRVLLANARWGEAGGPLKGGQALFRVLNEARRTGQGISEDGSLKATLLSEGRFLLRRPAETPAPAPVAPAASAAQPAAEAHELPTALAPFGAAVLDGTEPLSAVIVDANAALVEMTGGTSPVGRAFAELIDTASRQEAAALLAPGRTGPAEVRLSADPAKIAHLYVTGADERFVAWLIDVSAQKQMELELKQSQKMQAIGQLAGGVAHDFNNLLFAIELRLDELLARHPVGDPSYESLNQIRQTGARAADLVRKLLTYSRKQTVQRVTVDVSELIGESQVLFRRLLPEHMQLETHFGRDLPKVRADKSQLETAMMNLVVNARDAIRTVKPGPGGVISVRCARLTRAEAAELGYADSKVDAQELTLIEVADNGPGIPEAVRDKIFDPFFTTKAVGEGTGLGLSTVFGIVKQADGWIEAANRPEGGAVFRIFLPAYAPPAAETPAPEPAKAPKAAPRDLSGAGRILFVEDEDAVRGIAARLLRDRGYEVIEAADGEEALALAEENAGQIDLLISDVIMPGMGGPELLKEARQYLGAAPVMFISGYAESDFSDLLEGEANVTFLAKPLDIKTLAQKVKEQLQAA